MRGLLLLCAACATVAAQPPFYPRSPEQAASAVQQYVHAYESRLGGFVAEETYEQRVYNKGRAKRTLVSDFLLVRYSDRDDWMPFRDVRAVDGVEVRDRQNRLEELFLSPGAAADGARRIAEESARYNLGQVQRTINVPLLGLVFLRPENAGRLEFTVHTDAIDGLAGWRLDFREKARPTVIRGRDNANVPVRGSAWFHNDGPAIVRTRIFASDGAADARVDVTFCTQPGIEILVPCRMQEHYRTPREEVIGDATYAKVRRFTVTVVTDRDK